MRHDNYSELVIDGSIANIFKSLSNSILPSIARNWQLAMSLECSCLPENLEDPPTRLPLYRELVA